MQHKLAVFIGRFQPFHLGHCHVVDEALNVAGKVLILIGSSFEPRSLRNPWFFDERETMIRACFDEAANARIICQPIRDIRYNDALWVTQVQKAAYAIEPNDSQITLIGRQGNGNGYYSNLFPQWGKHTVVHDIKTLSTDLRTFLFDGGAADKLQGQVEDNLLAPLTQFMASHAGQDLITEYNFISLYKKGWENAPFEPTHVTVDAVVVQSGHVLLVKRGAQPGKGLLALPGGFIQSDETLLNGMVRKLREETQIKVPAPVLAGSVKNQGVFDAPFRSARGRTITHAFYIELRSEESLPKIKGGGDTSQCFWLPLGQIDSTLMFEDHYFIIQKMLGLI